MSSDTDAAGETGLSPDDDSTLDLSEIADYLAELSQPGQLPQGTGHHEPVPFTADEVDFSSNGWLQRLIEVQAWLCLDQPLQASSAPQTVTVLFSEISHDPPAKCFTASEGGAVRLTPLGMQHLTAWLSRADAHRRSFEEAIDDEKSFNDASDEWKLLWEEASTGKRQPIAINAKVTTWRIKEFKDLAAMGLLDLNPSYQRDVVWSNSDSQLLVESILRGIPLPSVILTQVEGEDRFQIVDGKQRLTAILRFTGDHPDARTFIEKSEGGQQLFEKSVRKFVAKNHLKPKDISENFLPFKLPKFETADDPLRELSGKYYSEIKQTKIEIGGGKTTPWNIFESPGSNYYIPIIIYERTRIQDIHHVFGLYNKQGKKLNAEEIRNASYHHLELMRLLLVLSGDRPAALAPYLPSDLRHKVDEVGELLSSLGFGTARFKRTKVLSWASAILLHPPGQPGSFISTPSTASHINALLDTINEDGSAHALFQRNNLVTFARDLVDSVVAHREASDAWHPKFRRKASKETLASKWEELPLIASLVATFVLVVLAKQNLLVERIADVRAFTEANRAPTKTQHKTQWQYIARLLTGMLTLLDISPATADSALEKRYGYACSSVLRRLSENAE